MPPFFSSPVSREDLASGLRLLWSLPPFLRQPIKPDEARAVLRLRLARREADFLELVHRTVFQNESSSYRELLKWAGCEWGDLERLVRQDGVKAPCACCRSRGVSHADEFKSQRPAVRGSTTVAGKMLHLHQHKPTHS
jgi:hypothetical protein